MLPIGSRSAPAIALLLLLALVSDVPAQSRKAREMTIEEIAKGRIQTGEIVRFTAKYLELRQEEVRLYYSPGRFLLRDPKVGRKLREVATPKENLTLEAVFRRSVKNKRVFDVVDVEAAPDDETTLRRDLEQLVVGGPENVPFLFDLGQRIYLMESEFANPSLRAMARRSFMEGVRLAEQKLKPDDAAGRFEVLRTVYASSRDRFLMVRLMGDLQTRFPTHKPIRTFLEENGCKKFRGRWTTYEEFKILQGFIPANGRWLSQREAEFLLAIDHYWNRPAELLDRAMTTAEYDLIARRQQVAPGMTRRETVKSRGYPDRVYRKVVRGKEFDQWLYGKNQLYFCNGLLFQPPDSWRRPSDPAPDVGRR